MKKIMNRVLLIFLLAFSWLIDLLNECPNLQLIPTNIKRDACQTKLVQHKQELCMTPAEQELFLKGVRSARRYFEIGSGGSTFHAALNGVEKIVSVESDREWHELLKSKIPPECNVDFQLVDFYTHNNWGNPGKNSTFKDWIKYSRSYKKEYNADMILIDGRFRVACALNVLKHIDKFTYVYIHDFVNRPYYHVVLDYYEMVDKADTLVKLRKIKEAPQNIIDEYERIAK